MSGIVAFDDLFPLKASPTVNDRVFGFDSGDGKSRGFTIQAILDLIAETPVTWTEISGRPTVFAPAAHSLGSHSNVSSGVDSATDGTFLRRVGGSWQAVTVDFYGVSNPPPADASVPDAVRGITAAQITQWNTAFGWGNHAGQYRPISYVPSWGEITGKPSTFAPSAHSLASHSDTTPLATAAEGQVIRKAAIGWEVFTPDYYSPFNPPPPDASVPDFVRDFTIGQFAGYEEKMLEFAGLPDGTLPMIKDGVPADSQLKGVMSENPFDPVTEPVEYDAFVSELLHLISTKRIKGPNAVDADDYATLGQVPDIDPAILAALNASLADSPGALNRYVSLNLLNSYGYVQEAPINGNWYARKDGAWSAFTPFTVAGTPTAGHVVTSVAGVPTWQAPSGGGGSKWTDGVNFIYRIGRVVIGQTTLPNSDSFFHVKTGTITNGNSKTISFINSNDVEYFSVTHNGFFNFNSSILRFNNPVSNAIWNFGFVYKGGAINGNSGSIFTLLASNDAPQFEVRTGFGAIFHNPLLKIGGISSTNNAEGGPTIKGGAVNGNFGNLFTILNSAEGLVMQIRPTRFIFYPTLFYVGNPTTPITGGAHFKGLFNNTAAIYRIDNSSDLIAVEVRGNRQILLPGVLAQTTDPLVAGALWNDSGFVKISAG